MKALILLAFLAAVGPARADILWHWSYSNTAAAIAASGVLTTGDLSAGSYLIKAVDGAWNGAAITGLEPIHTCCSPPGSNNNLLLDGGPQLDKGGFAFSVSGDVKINLFYKNGGYAYEIKNGREIFGGAFVASPGGAP